MWASPCDANFFSTVLGKKPWEWGWCPQRPWLDVVLLAMCKFIEKCSTLLRDRRQKTFKFLSRLCLLRGGGGGQAKSAKNCQFPDKSLLFQIGLTTPQWLQNSKMNPQDCPSTCWIVALMQTFMLGNMRTGPKRTSQKPKSQPAGNQS